MVGLFVVVGIALRLVFGGWVVCIVSLFVVLVWLYCLLRVYYA